MESPTISPNKEIQSEVIIEEVRGNCLCNHKARFFWIPLNVVTL